MVLDRRVVDRLRRHRNRLGLRGAMSARWVWDRRGEATLEIRAERFVFAEIVDYGRDGRADAVFVARR
jgi:hypothetical protein